ncbi:MAG: glycosyltransferase family 2 protein [Gammaproteobacteria bacterium]|nr:glycosyltransferase family 2 protein [Gammaproteobacteria bacterium]MCP5435479.1 glycosyltransferase family 2 protein [Chromatiaceae bacterium]MCW5586631.1 glycosyltransferase family 2 protein [Chromatiales bacterium]MCB1818504.1 glycosyltransferase family 2 protein [Gammaproteobacteria bacterium]HOP17079.1 glycosyltransferase family 2 protein [Gammaproteobacteria bacterium]
MPALPISVFIIARNEADRIALTIDSVKDWVDEVIVVDSGSDDDTVALSESLGARTVFNEWRGYGPQKVFAEGLCRNDWLLNLDADEEVSAELGAEIRMRFAAGEPVASAFTLPILPLYPFQTTGHRWTAFHHPVRLYRRSAAGFKDSPVHDSVVVREGAIEPLRGMVIHRSFRSLTHHVDKANEVSSLRAQDLADKGRDPSAFSLLLVPLFAFFKSFILRREFVNGVDGIVVSHMYAFQRFIRLAKTRERNRLAKRGG